MRHFGYSLLSVNSDNKTTKGLKYGVLTGILYLAPNKISGFNVCPHASLGCIDSCLNTAGRGKFSNVQLARIRKTKLYVENRANFLESLAEDIELLEFQAKRLKLKPAVRLNGTSDINYMNEYVKEGKTMFELFPNVQFYDYTKDKKRISLFSNYHLTYSRSEKDSVEQIKIIVLRGINVAIVFKIKDLPKIWEGIRVVSGELSDIRFRDDLGVIVGLIAKGRAKKDLSGFVVHA